ncbi:MAG: hypothetical protein BRD27_00680 [Bacteroidetes bacterium QH_10_64_19]|nr:MAG: hypothetical protein BRD27_00680 [Bacteroidetes bacterium QH_10_64_19]
MLGDQSAGERDGDVDDAGSVPKVTTTGEDHGHVSLVGGLDHVVVPDGPAGLDGGPDPLVRRCDQPVGKWEKCVGRYHGAAKVKFRLLRLEHRKFRRVDPAHLSGPYPQRGPVFRVHDGVALHVLRHPPGKVKVAPLTVGGGAGGGHVPAVVEVRSRGECGVGRLNEKPAEDRPNVGAIGVAVGRFVPHDATALPYPKNTFDALFSSYLIDVLPTPSIRPTLREMRRVLRPTGRLVLVYLASPRRPIERAWASAASALVPLFGGARPVRVRPHLEGTGLVPTRETTCSQRGLRSKIIRAAPA